MLARPTRISTQDFNQGALEMRKLNLVAWATFVLAVAGLVPLSVAQATQQDETAVRQASDRFYAALNAMFEGNIEPMNDLWSHADDVTYMGPDGKYIIGWDQVQAIWRQQAALKLGGKIEAERVHVTVGQDLATVECSEVGENFVDGKPTQVSIRATNTYRKENGQWKMIGHHTDTLPFLDQQ
jgi:ketosteroid isomerase-like protein